MESTWSMPPVPGAPMERKEKMFVSVVSLGHIRFGVTNALAFYRGSHNPHPPTPLIPKSVMDTGVYNGHEDLENLNGYEGSELISPWWEDDDGHGTHVAGTIAAIDNDVGVVGVAPGVEIFIARVFGPSGEFYSSDIVAALEACRDGGANVISMSLGGPLSSSNEQALLQSLYEEDNIVSIAAAGNSGLNEYMYPAGYDQVVGVAAVDEFGSRASFSTMNDKVDVAAPGVAILSSWNDGSYMYLDGTSMATPHVSGIAALILSYNPSLSAAEVFDILTSTASQSSNPDELIGHGIVDALAALNAAAGGGSNPGDDDDDDNDSATPEPTDGWATPEPTDDWATPEPTDAYDGSTLAFEVELQTDAYPWETAHWLHDQDDGVDIFYEWSFDAYSTYSEAWSLDPNGCYIYHIYDSFGDGMEAGYGVDVKVDGDVQFSGYNYASGGYIEIGRSDCIYDSGGYY
jgi:Subtilase family